MDPLEPDPPPARPYPFALASVAGVWSADSLQFGWTASASCRERLLRDLAERVARYLFGCAVRRRAPAPPRPRVALDLDRYRRRGLAAEVVYVAPAPVSATSLAIARALHDAGLEPAELARRLGSSERRVARITDPFYAGHSERTLRRIEAALGRSLPRPAPGSAAPLTGRSGRAAPPAAG